MPTPQELGLQYGNDMYELTRRRLSSGFGTARRGIGERLAGRGLQGTAGGMAFGDLILDEARATADASLEAQLKGTQLGFQESDRIEGIRRFDTELAQREKLSQAQFAHEISLAERQKQREIELIMLQEKFSRGREGRDSRRGLLGGLFGSIGKFGGQFLLNKFSPIPLPSRFSGFNFNE
jgi:hypothetical protein